MICERCREKEASVHLTEIIKEVKSDVHLCEKCARMNGLNPQLSNFSLSLPEMLSFLDEGDCDDSLDIYVCLTCGLTYLEYRKRGKLGCPDCYHYLWAALEPVISNYHNERKHIGKGPLNYTATITDEKVLQKKIMTDESTDETILQLDKKLEIAVLDERYEDAAQIRDKIKEIQSEK